MLSKAAIACALLAAVPAAAYTPSACGGVLQLRAQAEQTVSRRALGALFAGGVGAALVGGAEQADAVSARAGPNNVFTGQYEDPKHLGCPREIKITGAGLGPDGRRSRKLQAIVTGADGNPACDAGTEVKKWRLVGTVESEDTVFIDFSEKGGPKNLLGKWDGSGVVFPDGNKWTKKVVVDNTPAGKLVGGKVVETKVAEKKAE
mmetsp:Transcript_3629/g.7271  ORF Transcript_3629/g.7271 Transcript_3629/m.7271 type:complete len:204 (-) Transcript_3629:246-857(-)